MQEVCKTLRRVLAHVYFQDYSSTGLGKNVYKSMCCDDADTIPNLADRHTGVVWVFVFAQIYSSLSDSAHMHATAECVTSR